MGWKLIYWSSFSPSTTRKFLHELLHYSVDFCTFSNWKALRWRWFEIKISVQLHWFLKLSILQYFFTDEIGAHNARWFLLFTRLFNLLCVFKFEDIREAKQGNSFEETDTVELILLSSVIGYSVFAFIARKSRCLLFVSKATRWTMCLWM